MNIIQELRKNYKQYGFHLHDDGVIVSLRGGHKYIMTLEEARRLLSEIESILGKQNKR